MHLNIEDLKSLKTHGREQNNLKNQSLCNQSLDIDKTFLIYIIINDKS